MSSKTIRMTESLRFDIVGRIMYDVPTVDYYDQITAAMRKYVEASHPQFVLQMLADERAKIYLVTNTFHATVQKRKGSETGTQSYSVAVLGYAGKLKWADAPKPLKDEVQKLHFLKIEQEDNHAQLQDKLKRTLAQFKSVSAARKALPEFDKYFPKPDALPVQLPSVTSCVSALVEAGWDIVKNGTPSITSET